MKTKIIFIWILFLGFRLSAQSVNSAKIDSLVQLIESKQKGMGNISIFDDGKEVYQKSYGFIDLESKKKADGNSKYRIGSISKTLTATLIMKLIEDKKLTLDTKLSKFYPQIKNSKKITIEHLLRHRSGIYNFTNSPDYFQWNAKAFTKEDLLRKITSFEAAFNPDEKADYSNTNYVLLTFIAEDLTKKKYAELIQELIVKPLGLKNTFVGSKIRTEQNEALSYSKLTKWKLENETDMSIPLGAGAIVSTPTDLNSFINALFQGKILSNSSLEAMKTVKDDFGIGMFEIPFYEMKGFGHTGGIDGFQSMLTYFPEQKVSIAVTSNAVDYSLNQLINGVLSIYFNKEYQLPVFNDIKKLDENTLNKYVGTYSSSSFPLKIVINQEDGILIAQATGQQSFTLEYEEGNKFKFDPVKLKMEFFPNENKLIFKQGGAEFTLMKE